MRTLAILGVILGFFQKWTWGLTQGLHLKPELVIYIIVNNLKTYQLVQECTLVSVKLVRVKAESSPLASR